jgi:hypothetical protein
MQRIPTPRASRALIAAVVVAAASSLANAEAIIALRAGNEIVRFDSATPATVTSTAVTGLTGGETLVGIDFRPATGALYGITDQGRIYTINTATGAGTLAATSSAALAGTAFGVDFNPVADRLRVVSDANQNLRIDVTTGAANTDSSIAYAAADVNVGADPAVSAAGYTNSAAGVPTTTLFVIDPGADVLAVQNPPNNGILTTVGALGVNAAASAGLDISRRGNTAYAALEVSGTTALYRINLATGAATSLGLIGAGAAVRGIAVEPPPAPEEADVFGVTEGNGLVKFSTLTPNALTTIGPVTGLQASETVVAIDFRPANLVLYALGSTGRLYTINTTTAAATEVAPLSIALAGTTFGADFNPTVDRLRVVSDADQNLRVDPTNGSVTVDTNVAYAAGDVHVGLDALVVALGYTNNFVGALTTSLYAIDSGFDSLALQNPPNNGTLSTVGALGFDAGERTSLDIAGPGNAAFAAISPSGGPTSFYSVDLATGQATLIGPVGTGVTLRAMAVFVAIPLDADHVVLHFNYKKSNADKFMVFGELPALVGPVDGRVVTVDVGGVTQTFTLNRKGRARVGANTFALIGRPRNGTIRFRFNLMKGDFSDEMADEGMDGTVDAKKAPRTLGISVLVGEALHETTITVEYTAKAGKTGIAKFGPQQGRNDD